MLTTFWAIVEGTPTEYPEKKTPKSLISKLGYG